VKPSSWKINAIPIRDLLSDALAYCIQLVQETAQSSAARLSGYELLKLLSRLEDHLTSTAVNLVI
jgi:hypothetical protein